MSLGVAPGFQRRFKLRRTVKCVGGSHRSLFESISGRPIACLTIVPCVDEPIFDLFENLFLVEFEVFGTVCNASAFFW